MTPDSQTDQIYPGLESFSGIEGDLSAQGLFALAYWFDDSRQTDMALHYYHKALASDPAMAEAHYNMGVIYGARQERSKAIFHLLKSIELKPDIPESFSALAMFRFDEQRFEEALVLLEQAVAINPDFSEAHYNMGLVYQQSGEYAHSLSCFRKALDVNPDFTPARWLHMLSLPMIYDNCEQIDRARQRFTRNLDRLLASTPLQTPSQVQIALRGIQTATNFYLHYQCRNDLELQKKYGLLVHSAMCARYPQWSRRPSVPAPLPGEKIRIGYVSSHMYRHTVGVFLSGWVENHDHDVFQIHCYHIGPQYDQLTAHLEHLSHRFVHLPGAVESMASQIASDQPHILIYTDIGMNVETMQLASLRLAPVQCCGWGHPVTTGLPSIDYFLSSDLMEPEDADRFYSESLVRLPNLSLLYTKPSLPASPLTKKDLGLPDDRFIFLSPQSTFKYLPQFDDIYPQIAKGAPRSLFVFIDNKSQAATRRFRNRLRTVFHQHHLDADRYCHFSPRREADGYMSLNLAADVLLDTFEWSGGKTTLEAISCGLPVITCPGRFMRGRHTYAMLSMMGIAETIARDPVAYCRIAVRMASDPSYYDSIKTRVMKQRHKLYHDKTVITELERLYLSMVRHASTMPVNKE